MKYLFSNIDNVLKRVHSAEKILLLLDYDGTLTPIVKTPDLAILSSNSRRLLKKLSTRVVLGIISGRSLRKIKSLVRIPGIIYAGNHGLEIEYAGVQWRYPGIKEFSNILDDIAGVLQKKLGNIRGIALEHKGLTLAVHYRKANKRYWPYVEEAFNSAVSARKVKTVKGKRVFEAKPLIKWDKGKAALKIIHKMKCSVLPLYIGDDITDEDAFKAVKNKGITVYVGRPRNSCAEYFVWNVGEVIKLLRKI